MTGKKFPYLAAVKIDYFDLFFVFSLFLQILMRIAVVGLPLWDAEGYRDYLIGHNIVRYHDFPLTGADAGGVLKNSPSYYYFLATILLIKDDPDFLSLVNVLLQVLTIIAIYAIAKNMFGGWTALGASFLFGFSYYIILFQSTSMHPQYVMQPFVNLSYLLLLLSHLKRNTALLLWGIFAFVFGASLHMSAFLLTPMVLFAAVLILRKQRKPLRYFVLALSAFSAALLIFYFPSVMYHVMNSFTIYPPEHPTDNVQTNFIQQLFQSASFLVLPFSSNTSYALTPAIVAIIFGAALPLYFLLPIHKGRKIFLELLLGAIFLPVVLSSFLLSHRVLQPYYFGPVYGLFAIAAAETVSGVFLNGVRSRITKVLAAGLLILTFRSGFLTEKASLPPRSTLSDAPVLRNIKLNESVATVLKEKIIEIRNRENYDTVHFFQLAVYTSSAEARKEIDAAYWVLLEKKFDERFTKNDSTVWYSNYRAVNDDQYVFLICQNYLNEKRKACVDRFLREYPGYSLTEELYGHDRLAIYLARRGESSK